MDFEKDHPNVLQLSSHDVFTPGQKEITLQSEPKSNGCLVPFQILNFPERTNCMTPYSTIPWFQRSIS